MKRLSLILLFVSTIGIGQNKTETKKSTLSIDHCVKAVNNITLEAAFELTRRVNETAKILNKTVSIAILDAAGTTILLVRGEGVGPHNTEAARRKAYTALSTKTPTLLLLRNTAASNDAKNLNTLPELLLLSGGSPIWFKGNVIGSVGIAGGGSAENDDLLAKSASIPEIGITTTL